MARLLERQGVTVVLASRSEADVAAAVERLRAEGIAVSGRRCDTGELADVEVLRDEALSRGTLAIRVNNAGTSGAFGPTASTPVDDFTRVVRTNILGTFHGSRVALPVLSLSVYLGAFLVAVPGLRGAAIHRPAALQRARPGHEEARAASGGAVRACWVGQLAGRPAAVQSSLPPGTV